jgi:hypothetical protein
MLGEVAMNYLFAVKLGVRSYRTLLLGGKKSSPLLLQTGAHQALGISRFVTTIRSYYRTQEDNQQ